MIKRYLKYNVLDGKHLDTLYLTSVEKYRKRIFVFLLEKGHFIVFSIKNNKDFVRFSVTDFKTWHEISDRKTYKILIVLY
jgi:hypothetical protein